MGFPMIDTSIPTMTPLANPASLFDMGSTDKAAGASLFDASAVLSSGGGLGSLLGSVLGGPAGGILGGSLGGLSGGGGGGGESSSAASDGTFGSGSFQVGGISSSNSTASVLIVGGVVLLGILLWKAL